MFWGLLFYKMKENIKCYQVHLCHSFDSASLLNNQISAANEFNLEVGLVYWDWCIVWRVKGATCILGCRHSFLCAISCLLKWQDRVLIGRGVKETCMRINAWWMCRGSNHYLEIQGLVSVDHHQMKLIRCSISCQVHLHLTSCHSSSQSSRVLQICWRWMTFLYHVKITYRVSANHAQEPSVSCCG